MPNVVTRSLWLLAISTAIVLVSIAFFPPQATPHDGAGHNENPVEAPYAPPDAEHEGH